MVCTYGHASVNFSSVFDHMTAFKFEVNTLVIFFFFFRGCTVHLDIIKVFFIFTNGCTIYLLRSTLKFTLQLLLHVLVVCLLNQNV